MTVGLSCYNSMRSVLRLYFHGPQRGVNQSFRSDQLTTLEFSKVCAGCFIRKTSECDFSATTITSLTHTHIYIDV